MKSFREFLETEAPASTTVDVAKPDGGKVKKDKKPPVSRRKEDLV